MAEYTPSEKPESRQILPTRQCHGFISVKPILWNITEGDIFKSTERSYFVGPLPETEFPDASYRLTLTPFGSWLEVLNLSRTIFHVVSWFANTFCALIRILYYLSAFEVFVRVDYFGIFQVLHLHIRTQFLEWYMKLLVMNTILLLSVDYCQILRMIYLFFASSFERKWFKKSP